MDTLNKIFDLIVTTDGLSVCLLIHIIVWLINATVSCCKNDFFKTKLYSKFRKVMLGPIVGLLFTSLSRAGFGWPWPDIELGHFIVVSITCGYSSGFAYELFIWIILKKFGATLFKTSIPAIDNSDNTNDDIPVHDITNGTESDDSIMQNPLQHVSDSNIEIVDVTPPPQTAIKEVTKEVVENADQLHNT